MKNWKFIKNFYKESKTFLDVMKIMKTLFKSFFIERQLLQKLIYNFYDQKPLKVIKTSNLVYLKKNKSEKGILDFFK